MTTWILVLMLVSGQPRMAITVVPGDFWSQEACEAAGKAWYQGERVPYRLYVCLPRKGML